MPSSPMWIWPPSMLKSGRVLDQSPTCYQLPTSADAAFKTCLYSVHHCRTSPPPPNQRPCHLFFYTFLPPPAPSPISSRNDVQIQNSSCHSSCVQSLLFGSSLQTLPFPSQHGMKALAWLAVFPSTLSALLTLTREQGWLPCSSKTTQLFASSTFLLGSFSLASIFSRQAPLVAGPIL